MLKKVNVELFNFIGSLFILQNANECFCFRQLILVSPNNYVLLNFHHKLSY